MTKQIRIREDEIDFVKLIQMNLSRKDWGKAYTLFTSGDLTVNCEMISFDFRNSAASFRINFTYNYKDQLIESGFTKDYYTESFNVKDFRRVVITGLRNELLRSKERILRDIAEKEYKALFEYRIWNDRETYCNENGFEDEVSKILSMELEDDMQEEFIDLLYNKIRDGKNELYYEKIDEYIAKTTLMIPSVDKLLLKLNKELK